MAYPPQQGQYGHPRGGPPKKDRAPLIAGLIFVAALLAGLGITGFVAPGFFLPDDKGGGSSAGRGDRPAGVGDGPADPTLRPGGAPADDTDDSGGSESGGAGDGEAFAGEFVTALNELDSSAANDMYCPDAVGGMVDHVIKKGPELAVDTTESSTSFLKVTLTGTLGGEPLRSGKLSVQLKGSSAPCIFTFTAA